MPLARSSGASIFRVNQTNARFDEKKLAHMNMVYLLEQPADRFVALARDYLKRKNTFAAGCGGRLFPRRHAAEPAEGEVDRRTAGLHGVLFHGGFAVDPKARDKVMGKGDPKARLRELADALKTADFSSDAALEQAVHAQVAAHGVGLGDYIHPGRLAISGTSVVRVSMDFCGSSAANVCCAGSSGCWRPDRSSRVPTRTGGGALFCKSLLSAGNLPTRNPERGRLAPR